MAIVPINMLNINNMSVFEILNITVSSTLLKVGLMMKTKKFKMKVTLLINFNVA